MCVGWCKESVGHGGVLVPQCFCAGGGTVRTPSTLHPSPMDPPTSLLYYDITLHRPSQPRLVGSDKRVSQLVPRSHVIRGDVAASAAGWAGALHSLIRRLRGVERGCLFVCVCVFVHCVCACVLCLYGRKPSKHGSQAKRFAYRHKAPDTTHGRPRQCGTGQIGPGGKERRWRRDRQH